MLVVLSAIGVFAATNIDDLIVLTTLYAAGVERRAIVVGQYLGVAALVLISVALALALGDLPDRWVGLFGIVPIALGIRALVRHERGAPKIVTTIAGVMGLTLANGADNVSVYVPIFRSVGLQAVVYVVVFAVLVAVWLVAARWIASRKVVTAALERYGHVVVPIVYIAIGSLLIYGSISN
jgi:cadmium resistance protein CadD (predicted permease)